MTLPPFHILCVDDDTDTCELIEAMLKHHTNEYELTTETDPQKALILIKEQPFDLYIFDYAMPGVTGLDLCGLIRQKGLLTPIIIFTAMARNTDKELAIKAGANEFLIKPNDLDKLAETVERLLHGDLSFSAEDLLY